jgi:hypothetical protein
MDSSTNRSTSLVEAQRARKQMERDALLLANRIKLLQQEEAKTWKKIEETKTKAKEILDIKKAQEERAMLKEEIKKKKDEELEKQRENYNKLRQERRKGKEELKETILKSRRDNAINRKMERYESIQKKNEASEMMKQENETRKQMVKQQKEIGTHRIIQHHNQKREDFKSNYTKRIEDEEKLRQEHEKKLLDMELFEMELIKKLQNTQSIQKKAFQDLQEALGQPAFKNTLETLVKSTITKMS